MQAPLPKFVANIKF